MTFNYNEAFSRNTGWVTAAEQEVLRGKRIVCENVNSLQTKSLLYDRNSAPRPLICNRKRTLTANPERSLEYEICSERYLCLVCRDCCGSAVLIDGHLVGNSPQQLIKQDNA